MRRQLLAIAALSAAVALGTATSAAAAEPVWQETDTAYVDSLGGSQGLASRADGSLLHRGLASIPLDLRLKGWNHIGDPDIAQDHVFDAYQGADSATSKMFAVTTPDGKRYEYVHQLDAGEKVNNSFAAVSPDGQWLVSGEWGDQDRLQVFPAPLLNPATPKTGGDLPQAPQITLDKPVRDIQGCDFVDDTRLLCASDDGSKELFEEDRPLLQVDLTHRLDGTPVTGHVTSLFALPQRSACSGTFEAEGVDYDTTTGTLRVEVVPPGVCKVATTVYSYRQQ
ncbi:hypothetical protein [Streptomyces thermodiastaticus]|uniref:hypothetical protein n=1 Tax=Streptomyces thermodiastaticus TaxID=44061 RepID=UPI0016737614|nr:hypothetical protein [Streptomyces thermodiastaticus]MCE7552338.1 hypothetical protein [Streptomyces thermodiastaticus]GHF83985.1 hypothetical protein GCM10018787_36060 [Streptomyces thermodiastaticus]